MQQNATTSEGGHGEPRSFCCSSLFTALSLLFSSKQHAPPTTTTSATAHSGSESPPPPPPPSSSPPSSSSNCSLPRAKYEVFLSFRGPDTRRGFTDFLFTYLVDARIHTYRDDEELRKGEQIGPELLAAISESKIAIPVFSKDYASSKWCLQEVAKMVECRNSTGQKILPVFYSVEPTDVRHQTGSYAEAFRRHEKQFDKKTVQEWRDALREVGTLKGWSLKQDSDTLEGSVVKDVALTVLSLLRGDYMLLTDELVGIEHNMEEVMKLLNAGFNDVRIVGIHGMGGIGKTTLATVIYNQLLAGYEHCCFLADVRETLERHEGLVALQHKLITSTLKEKSLTIANSSEGINVIKNRVCKAKLLVVLDDVDSKFKFEKTLGRREWFAKGSTIIITTRDKKVLNTLKVDGMYEPEELKPEHSLQLFSKHAFGEDTPPPDFVQLSNDIASTAAGLPLALKVIGALLYGEEKPIWEETLKQLREIPPDEVQEKLKVSFTALTYEQKQIFLDIACLLIGTDKEIASYMWDDCKFYPTIGINVLVLRSLVKIGDDNKFSMHDQLRDLGRAIVREENIEDPWERSRLWSHKDAFDTLKTHKGTEKVKALHVDLALEPKSASCLTNQEFTKLSNLRYLGTDSADIMGNFSENPLCRLRWLHWHNCPGNSSPTNLQLMNLVTLDLTGSKVTNDWEGWNEIQMAEKLKVLDLSFCRALIKTPELSSFKYLERLVLEGCGSLVHIEPSIRDLKNLKILRLCGSEVKKFPDDIGALEKLEELDASCCSSLEGPVPPNIVGLSSLRILMLDSTMVSGIPTGLCRLSCLQTLDLQGTNVQWLPELPCSLTKLIVTCTFPNLEDLVNLQELRFFDCQENIEISKAISKLSKLKILGFHVSNISMLPAEITELSKLKELSLITCKGFHCLLGVPSSLDKLYVQGRDCPIERLPNLSHLKLLTGLRLWCTKLTKIEGLEGLKCLIELIITGCKSLASLDGLERLGCLRILFMDDCDSLERLPNLSNLKSLKWLDCSECWNLIEIQGIGGMESLQTLCMSDCVAMETLPNLSNLGMLRQLNLCNCQSLPKIEGLPALTSLESLDMSDCQSLVSLPDLSPLERLQKLILNDSQSLYEIEGLGTMNSLETLNISGCIKLETVPDVSNLKNLKELLMNDCVKLTQVPGLKKLATLKLLEMNGCRSFQSLPDMSGLKNLEKLCLSCCENIIEIRGLEELRSLTLLDISGCKLTQNLPELPNTDIIT